MGYEPSSRSPRLQVMTWPDVLHRMSLGGCTNSSSAGNVSSTTRNLALASRSSVLTTTVRVKSKGCPMLVELDSRCFLNADINCQFWGHICSAAGGYVQAPHLPRVPACRRVVPGNGGAHWEEKLTGGLVAPMLLQDLVQQLGPVGGVTLLVLGL